MIIRSRAPLRLGLAGGGTDVSPYCDEFGGYVLNATIDRYAYAVLRILDEPTVNLLSTDQRIAEKERASANLILNGSLNLHKAVYNYIVSHYNNGKPIPLELTTYCDAPIGSGLGSSSTLVVAMIRAFVELLNIPLDDYTIAQIAYKIERIDCGLQGGRQDQYSATFGGFNFMEFYANERAIINPLRIKNWIVCELEASLLLFYTGLSRESSKIIADQSSNVKSRESNALHAMDSIKHEALAMKESLLRGDFSGFVDSMQESWESKKMTAKMVSSQHIDKVYDAAINAGALAGKISGAGGGGFMLFFVPPEKRMNVIRALSLFQGQVSNCHFSRHGCQAWRL